MITAIVHHYIVPELLKQTEAMIKENGRLMRSYPGFISRQTLIAQNDPCQVTTVTTWRSAEDRQRWDSRPDRPQPQPSVPTPWAKPIEAVAFTVTPES